MRHYACLTLCALLALPENSKASTIVAVELLSQFNAVTIGDYTPQRADTEGRALVGGTMTVSGPLPFNSNDTSNSIAAYVNQFSFASTSDRLRVLNGGVITPSSPNVVNFEFQGGGSLTSGSAGQTATDNLYQSLGITSATLGATMIAASASWRDLSATATITNPGQNLQFNAGSGVAVFNISASDVFQQNYNPSFTIQPDTTAILINVSGTSINNKSFGQNSFVNLSDQLKGLIIWNFYEATALDLGKFGGAVFAPQANANINEPNGSVVAATLTHSDELHLDLFKGVNPEISTIPEPGTSLLLLLSSTLIGARRRRTPSSQ